MTSQYIFKVSHMKNTNIKGKKSLHAYNFPSYEIL